MILRLLMLPDLAAQSTGRLSMSRRHSCAARLQVFLVLDRTDSFSFHRLPKVGIIIIIIIIIITDGKGLW